MDGADCLMDWIFHSPTVYKNILLGYSRCYGKVGIILILVLFGKKDISCYGKVGIILILVLFGKKDISFGYLLVIKDQVALENIVNSFSQNFKATIFQSLYS